MSLQDFQIVYDTFNPSPSISRTIYHIFSVQKIVLIQPHMMYLTQIISFTLTRGMKLYNYDTNNFCTDYPPYSPAPIIIMSNTESLVFLLLQADDDDCAFAELKKYSTSFRIFVSSALNLRSNPIISRSSSGHLISFSLGTTYSPRPRHS